MKTKNSLKGQNLIVPFVFKHALSFGPIISDILNTNHTCTFGAMIGVIRDSAAIPNMGLKENQTIKLNKKYI